MLTPGFYISSSRTAVGVRSIYRVSQTTANARTSLIIYDLKLYGQVSIVCRWYCLFIGNSCHFALSRRLQVTCYFEMLFLVLRLGSRNMFMFRCWMIWLKHFCSQMEKEGQNPFKTLIPGSQCNTTGSETSFMLRYSTFGKGLCWSIATLAHLCFQDQCGFRH